MKVECFSKGKHTSLLTGTINCPWKDCRILTWTSASWDECLLPQPPPISHQHWMLKISYTFVSLIGEKRYFLVLIFISINPWETKLFSQCFLAIHVSAFVTCLIVSLLWVIFVDIFLNAYIVNRFYDSLTHLFDFGECLSIHRGWISTLNLPVFFTAPRFGVLCVEEV